MVSFVWPGSRAILVAVHNGRRPDDGEWDEYLVSAQEMLRQGPEAIGGLAVTDGGSPGHSQRALLNRIMAGRSVPSAVITESIIVRSAIKAMRFFNYGIQGFSRSDLGKALDYLGVAPDDHGPLMRAVDAARAKLSCEA
jgi:hypothetical protein